MEPKKPKNPVAKFAHLFNKSKIFDEKTEYKRKPKHKKDLKNADDNI